MTNKAKSISQFIIEANTHEDNKLIIDIMKAKKEIALSTNHKVLLTQFIEGIHFNIIRYIHKVGKLWLYRTSFILFEEIHYSYFLANNINEITNKLGERSLL